MSGFGNWSEHKARVTHNCQFCGRQITPGMRYKLWKGVYDGHWDNTKLHKPCLRISWELAENDSDQWYPAYEWDFKDIIEQMRKHGLLFEASQYWPELAPYALTAAIQEVGHGQ